MGNVPRKAAKDGFSTRSRPRSTSRTAREVWSSTTRFLIPRKYGKASRMPSIRHSSRSTRYAFAKCALLAGRLATRYLRRAISFFGISITKYMWRISAH